MFKQPKPVTQNPFIRKPNEKLSIYILKVLGLGALFTAVTILSPTFLYAVVSGYLSYKPSDKPNRQQIQKSLSYLKQKRFIAFKHKDGKIRIIITKLGKKRLEKIKLSEISIPKTVWDTKWRLLTFDIPESESSARQTFRRKLKEMGFFHFQRSVFVIPYECEKEVNQITRLLKIRPYVHLITAIRFQNDKELIKKFDLRSLKRK